MKLNDMYFVLCNGHDSEGIEGGILHVKCPLHFQDNVFKLLVPSWLHSFGRELLGALGGGASLEKISCYGDGLSN